MSFERWEEHCSAFLNVLGKPEFGKTAGKCALAPIPRASSASSPHPSTELWSSELQPGPQTPCTPPCGLFLLCYSHTGRVLSSTHWLQA